MQLKITEVHNGFTVGRFENWHVGQELADQTWIFQGAADLSAWLRTFLEERTESKAGERSMIEPLRT